MDILWLMCTCKACCKHSPSSYLGDEQTSNVEGALLNADRVCQQSPLEDRRAMRAATPFMPPLRAMIRMHSCLETASSHIYSSCQGVLLQET